MRFSVPQRGFSLVELLVVVSIIGILAGVITVSSGSARAQGRDTKRQADLQLVASALELYRLEKRTYPPESSISAPTALDWTTQLKPVLSPQYISSWPVDPSASSGFSYAYTVDASRGSYVLEAVLETPQTATAGSCDTGKITGICTSGSGDATTYKYRVVGP